MHSLLPDRWMAFVQNTLHFDEEEDGRRVGGHRELLLLHHQSRERVSDRFQRHDADPDRPIHLITFGLETGHGLRQATTTTTRRSGRWPCRVSRARSSPLRASRAVFSLGCKRSIAILRALRSCFTSDGCHCCSEESIGLEGARERPTIGSVSSSARPL